MWQHLLLLLAAVSSASLRSVGRSRRSERAFSLPGKHIFPCCQNSSTQFTIHYSTQHTAQSAKKKEHFSAPFFTRLAFAIAFTQHNSIILCQQQRRRVT